MCAAREPRRFNGLCDTCCWLGHLSCDCLLQRDRIYSDVPSLSSPPISPPSYSGRSGGPGYDIPCSPPQYSGSRCYRAKPFVRRYSVGDSTALSPQQQPAPRPFSSFVQDQRYNGCHSIAPPQQPAPRPFPSFVRDQRYNGGYSVAPPQQPRSRPFSSFGWDQRYACHSRPPVNAGLANNITQGQAQRDVGVDDRAEQQRPKMKIDCHGGPVPEVSGPREVTAPLARGGLPLQTGRQRRLQPPSGTLSPPTVVISDSAFEEWLQLDNMEMPMLSQSEGPQQSAPTAVTLAAAAPAAEAVTGTRVFPAASSKGVAEAPALSAGATSAAVPVAAPATGGTVFPTASVGGAARAPASADGIAALTAAPVPAVLFPSLHQLGGRPRLQL